MTVLLLFLCSFIGSLLVPTSAADAKKPCCFYRQFTAQVTIGFGSCPKSGEASFTKMFGKYYYDFDAKQLMINSTASSGKGHSEKRATYMDYANKKVYNANFDAKTCFAMPLNLDPMDPCIAKSSKLVSSGKIAGIDSDIFDLTYGGWTIITTITRGNCFPVSQAISGTMFGSPLAESITFLDYKQGVPSGAFVIPSFCPKK